MSYGHAEWLARQADRPPPVPREVWERPEMRTALAQRDIGRVYKLLKQDGVAQREIARRTGQRQSEVSEIIQGRQVRDVTVLERIADGLGVRRELMRLLEHAPDDDAYPGREAPQSGVVQEVTDDVLRRDALALGSLAAFGQVVVGTLAGKIPHPGGGPLPSRLGMTDVAEITAETELLRTAARVAGGQARNAVAAAKHYRALTQVPVTETVAKALGSELAGLHEFAGWCCFDSGMYRHALWHYREAADLAHRVGDYYYMASAHRYIGIVVDWWSGQPNEALKHYQMAQFKLGPHGDAKLAAWLDALSADALAAMGHEKAPDHLTRAWDSWEPANAFEVADWNYQTALVQVELGNLEVAERLAASVNGTGRHRPVGVFANVLRATLHVQTGEPRGLLMAKSAIDAVALLRSQRARERLLPLADALEARHGSDHQQLARMARQVATTRA